MREWSKPEIEELEIKSTKVVYEKTPEEDLIWGPYRYWDGIKWIYVDNITESQS